MASTTKPSKPKKQKLERVPEDIRERTLEDVSSIKELTLTKKQKGRKRLKLGFWERRNLRMKPEHSFVVTMIFLNGTRKTFIITTNQLTFKHNKRTYYLYYEESLYDISLSAYHLTYFENIAVPINREVVLDGDEAFFSATPENLQELIDMRYISALAGSDQMPKWVKAMIIMLALTLVGVVVVALQMWGASGG